MAPAPISPLPSAEPVSGQSVAGGRPRRRAAAAGPAAAAPTPASPRAAAGNPSLRLDPGLGLVVIEFHNAAGTVTGTIPTAQQLQAYRRWETAQVGPPAQATPLTGTGGGSAPPAPVPGTDSTPPVSLAPAAPLHGPISSAAAAPRSAVLSVGKAKGA